MLLQKIERYQLTCLELSVLINDFLQHTDLAFVYKSIVMTIQTNTEFLFVSREHVKLICVYVSPHLLYLPGQLNFMTLSLWSSSGDYISLTPPSQNTILLRLMVLFYTSFLFVYYELSSKRFTTVPRECTAPQIKRHIKDI